MKLLLLCFCLILFCFLRRKVGRHLSNIMQSALPLQSSGQVVNFFKKRTYFAHQFVDGVGDHSVRLYENSLPHKKVTIIQEKTKSRKWRQKERKKYRLDNRVTLFFFVKHNYEKGSLLDNWDIVCVFSILQYQNTVGFKTVYLKLGQWLRSHCWKIT